MFLLFRLSLLFPFSGGIHSMLRGPYAMLVFEMNACERCNLCSLNLIKKVGFVLMWKLIFIMTVNLVDAYFISFYIE